MDVSGSRPERCIRRLPVSGMVTEAFIFPLHLSGTMPDECFSRTRDCVKGRFTGSSRKWEIFWRSERGQFVSEWRANFFWQKSC